MFTQLVSTLLVQPAGTRERLPLQLVFLALLFLIVQNAQMALPVASVFLDTMLLETAA